MWFALATALGATPLVIQLPPDQPIEEWEECLALAGLTSGSGGAAPWMEVVDRGDTWTLRVRGSGSPARELTVPEPKAPNAREDVAILSASLLRPLVGAAKAAAPPPPPAPAALAIPTEVVPPPPASAAARAAAPPACLPFVCAGSGACPDARAAGRASARPSSGALRRSSAHSNARSRSGTRSRAHSAACSGTRSSAHSAACSAAPPRSRSNARSEASRGSGSRSGAPPRSRSPPGRRDDRCGDTPAR